MDKKLACTLFTSYDIGNDKIAADLKQISSAHLKITKNCKVQRQFLKSLQNCTNILEFACRDILNCGDIREKGSVQRKYYRRLWKFKLFADYGSLLRKLTIKNSPLFQLECIKGE